MQPNLDSQHIFQPGTRFCWLSGWTCNYRPPNWYGPNGLQIAHIASGAGRAMRIDDRRAVISLSPLCHMLHVSDATKVTHMTIASQEWPTIDERHTLYLKQKMDPEYYDRNFLSHYWIGILPSPEPPPEFWCKKILDNQGIIM